jgi:hypothetical protein
MRPTSRAFPGDISGGWGGMKAGVASLTGSFLGWCAEYMSLVLLDRIELSTSPLPRGCSTTELQQRPGPRI